MKLSKAQQKVVDLMSDGWELGRGGGLVSRSWLQKNGIGRGGEYFNISSSTFQALYKRGVIGLKKQGYPTSTYMLTGGNNG